VDSRGRLGGTRFLGTLFLVSTGAAAFAVAFRATLTFIYSRLYGGDNVVEAMTALPWWWRFLVPAVGATLAGLLSGWPTGRRQGVSNVMEAVALGRVQLSMRKTSARAAASWTAIAAGMSIGREGPLIEFGGTLGAAFARAAGLSRNRSRVLVAAGTAAGFGAAYNTPFAAVLFVLETMVGITALDALLPMMTAVVIATSVTRAVVGGGPIYGERAFQLTSSWELAGYAILGVLAAVAAMAFKHVLSSAERLAARAGTPQPYRAAIGGLIVGAIIVWLPDVGGNGYEPLNRILNGPAPPAWLVVLLVAKVAATTASVASGVPGGIFTPTLLVGGVLGTLWAQAIAAAGLPVNAGTYALVGMAASTAATVHAPLTAAVMIFELSGDYPIVLPLLLATVAATASSRRLGEESIYETELRQRGLGWEMTLDGRRVAMERIDEQT
jgi:CIC family chloride channel protein